MLDKSVVPRNPVVSWRAMDSCYRTMHVAGSSNVAGSNVAGSFARGLVDSFTLSRIESNLIERKHDLVQASSWMMNIVMLVLVAAGFGTFLYIQYHATAQEEVETKRIPFEPIPWLSATRNVRMEEYGRQLKPREAQTGYGLPGPIDGDGFSSVYGDYTSRATRD